MHRSRFALLPFASALTIAALLLPASHTEAASTTCRCFFQFHTSTDTGSGTSCTAAQIDLDGQITAQYSCPSPGVCNYSVKVTVPCHLVGNTYEISGYGVFGCFEGTGC